MLAPRRNVALLDPVRPDLGLTDQYTKVLYRWLEQIHADMTDTLLMQYSANRPATIGKPDLLAHDDLMAGPAAKALTQQIEKLGDKWRARIDAAAPALAAWFAKKVHKRTDQRLLQILNKAGALVPFDNTRATGDVLAATIAENVSLIRSIPYQHLAEVEQLVMRSVSQGRNASDLAKELEARYKVTKRRAALIARDQNNKATAAIQRVRQVQLGITQAQWVHSHAGIHPRPSHLANDGKLYDVAKGAFLDGKYVWPGTEINCRCVSRAVLPALQGLTQ
jgi:SPP1 gp7 family putative phage head morphogenesis protein